MRMLSIPALTISVIRIKTMSNLLIRCSTSLGLSNSLVVEIAKEECPKPDVSSLISAGEAFKHLKNNPKYFTIKIMI